MKYFLVLILISFSTVSCDNSVLPKPSPYLKLSYPQVTYSKIKTNCPYSFEVSDLAKFNLEKKCWATIQYPHLKATLYLTYRPVTNNLDQILKEVEKLTFKHTIKADVINSIPYENKEKKVYAELFNVEGNVATNIQFRATDSVNNVLAGALYFYVKPNYDSIVPAVKYVEKDIIHLIETLQWK